MEYLYIVVYRRSPESRWTAISEGELPTEQMALNLIECKKAAGWHNYEFAIVAGPVLTAEYTAGR
jgi:hypothetical protein